MLFRGEINVGQPMEFGILVGGNVNSLSVLGKSSIAIGEFFRGVSIGVSAVFSPVLVSTSQRYDSLMESSSTIRIFESSGDQSTGSQPPPASCVKQMIDFGSAGFMTHRSVSLPVRRVDM